MNLAWGSILTIWIAGATLLGGVYTMGHVKGTESCAIKNAKIEAATVAKESQSHAKIETKVMSLSDKRLDAGLSRFMRD